MSALLSAVKTDSNCNNAVFTNRHLVVTSHSSTKAILFDACTLSVNLYRRRSYLFCKVIRSTVLLRNWRTFHIAGRQLGTHEILRVGTHLQQCSPIG